MNKSEQLIACLEGEIAKRDARIVELDDLVLSLQCKVIERDAELSAIKAQEPVEYQQWSRYENWDRVDKAVFELGLPGSMPERFRALYAAPVSEAKAQGEHGDAYQGAREDLAIWKRRALEAEGKVRHQEQIIDRMGEDLNAINGPTFMGEPVLPAKAQGVVMPERWNVPRPMWKDARQPYGNPLNHADIEAAEKFNLALDEVARLNAAPVQQVSVPDVSAMARILADRNADACNVNREDNWAIYGRDYIDDVTAMLDAIKVKS